MFKFIFPVFLLLSLMACNQPQATTYHDVQITGAMKQVMWQGELFSKINLDTITNKSGLYGLGPESYLTGEILINNGEAYVSRVLPDSSMTVEKTFGTGAPFLVYANVETWTSTTLPDSVTNIKDLEIYIDQKTKNKKRPFAFILTGQISKAVIHVQNLPEGSKVSSPDEAHQGQVDYILSDEAVEIVGFFSTEHQAVFTHHDSFLHMHLITKDEKQMGHLDRVEFKPGAVSLYLPKK